MDPIATLFTNLGLGTALVAAQCWFLRYLVTVTIPALLAQHREDLAQLRSDTDRRHDAVVAALQGLSVQVAQVRDTGCGHYAYVPRQRGKEQ